MLEALAEGLVNVSSLARKIQPEVEKAIGKPVNNSAIVMAINRMPQSELLHMDKNLRQFFRKMTDISVRSGLLDYTFLNSETLLSKQVELLKAIGEANKVFYSFSQGVSETTIVISESMSKKLEAIFQDEKMLVKEKDLCSISLMLPEGNQGIYGVYYYILKELALQGINLVEMISTSNEYTIVLASRDLDQAFSLLMGLRHR
jgi:aspartokinase